MSALRRWLARLRAVLIHWGACPACGSLALTDGCEPCERLREQIAAW